MKLKLIIEKHMIKILEMANYSKKYDVAVIDEVQMIADQKRGHSWT